MNKTTNKQLKLETAVEKIRKFRSSFYEEFMKRHKKFDIYQFTTELLNKPVSKTA